MNRSSIVVDRLWQAVADGMMRAAVRIAMARKLDVDVDLLVESLREEGKTVVDGILDKGKALVDGGKAGWLGALVASESYDAAERAVKRIEERKAGR